MLLQLHPSVGIQYMRRTSPLRWFLAYPLLGTSSHRGLAVAAFRWQQARLKRVAIRPCNGQALYSTWHQSEDVLTSTSSNTVKRFVGLQQKAKNRRESGETVVEGPRMVLDLLRKNETRGLVRQIVVATDLDESIRDELDRQLRLHVSSNSNNSSQQHSIHVQMALPAVVKACSDTVTPQGIVARIQLPAWDANKILQLAKDEQIKRAPLYLVLDGVSDPGNVGTLLRSSVAVGVAAVLLLPGSCDVWNPKAVRSAMGSSFLVPTFPVSSWDDALEQLGAWKCRQIWAATMLQDNQGQVISKAHYDVGWNIKEQPQALVIGAEGSGLSPVVRESLVAPQESRNTRNMGIRAVHVPMQGTIESLNAAVCGSVILFEYMRQWQQQTL
jgi:RNA methyltransferase, TrmH family